MKLSTRHHPTSCLQFVVKAIYENSSPSAGEEILMETDVSLPCLQEFPTDIYHKPKFGPSS
jgi:hypothetical protein